MPLNNIQNSTIGNVTINTVQGNYNQTIQVVKDENHHIFELYSRLSQNFGNEPHYSIRHEQNLRKATEGTCTWLAQSQAFTQWRNDILTKKPVLWVHGTPGSGKSTLCSQAIRSLADVGAIVAYHFCDFARPHKEIEVLSMLTCQLLDPVLSVTPDSLPPLPQSATAPLQLKAARSLRSIIEQLVHRSTKAVVYFVLDGVDEELGNDSRWYDGICPVLEFLVSLAQRFPQHVRLWVSSQRRDDIRNSLKNFESIDIVPFARGDIELYLTKKVYEIQGPREADQKLLLESLQGGAEGSFMWARLMVEELKQRPTLADMKEFIKRGFPRNLNDYYRRIFDGYPPHLRPLACKVFSLLVYAKRPLRFCELWEAVWCLSSGAEGVLNPDHKPYKPYLDAVFQPFVELIPVHPAGGKVEKSDASQFTCHLIHSTLKDFLVGQRSVLCAKDPDSKEMRICPELAVKACLRYLLQPRFSDLLQKKGDQWHDISGTPVMESRFLIYAAKYWDKHLDAIEHPDQQKDFIPRVVSFVKSPNFWTVIQVQAIWVQAQFNTFFTMSNDDTKWLRRMFPLWFKEAEEGFQVWIQNRSFLRQWRYFLCSDTSLYPGELDYIWTGALGRNHFLAGRKSRVDSFPIAPDQLAGDRMECTMFFTDLVDDSGSGIYTLEISYDRRPNEDKGPSTSGNMMRSAVTLKCKSRSWKFENHASDPIVEHEQVLEVSARGCDFDLYVHDPSNPYAQTDRAPLAAFSSNGRTLRVGSNIFVRGSGSDRFSPLYDIHSATLENRKTRYVEEATSHRHFLAVTSRMKLSNKDVHDLPDSDSDVESWCSSKEANRSDIEANSEIETDDDDHDDDDGDEDDDDDDDSSSGDSRGVKFASDDDSVSEASSAFSNQERFEDDEIAPWDDPDDRIFDESESEDEDSGDDEHEDGLSIELDSSDSEEEDERKHPPTKNRPPPLNPQLPLREEGEEEEGEGEGEGEEGDWDGLPQYFSDQRVSHSKPRAEIIVFDTRYGDATFVFGKQVRLKCKLYASPPVFHPSKPLLVWPLGDGKILFVDYERKSSFTRTLRPSTAFTRHVAIHCAFSSCGQFMHLAALEGRRPDPQLADFVEKHKIPIPLLPLQMAMFVSTYRLSSKKPTRSPPALIHRIRIDLKEVKGINTRQLPFNLTWTKDYLYVTGSWKLLQVWRVPLFRDLVAGEEIKQDDEPGPSCDDSQLVLAPEKVVFMPKTCGHRSVQFFPSVDREVPVTARVVVGHEASVVQGQSQFKRCPSIMESGNNLLFDSPVVCYLDEERILGRWVDSMSRTQIMENLGIGILDPPEGVEKFNPEDDCELEPYYY